MSTIDSSNALMASMVNGNVSEIYKSLPSVEVSPSLSFSELLVTAQDPAAAGTILQTDGSPVAVLFNIKQFESVQKILDFIPNIVQKIKTEYETNFIPYTLQKFKLQAESGIKTELSSVGTELLKVSMPLKKALIMMGCGTIAVLFGAYILGRNSQIRSHRKPSGESYSITPSQITTRRIVGCLTTVIGIGLIVRSMMLTHQVSSACLTLAVKLKA